MTLVRNLRSKEFLSVLGLQLIFYVVVLFDIPVARQVIGFVYLTFVPGMIISRIFQLGTSSWPRRILFSAGFSIAFLLFAGLLINIWYPTIGISQPLTLIPLVVTLNPIILLLAFASCFRKDIKHLPTSIDRKSVLPVSALLCLPAIAIAGALLMNFRGNNSLLLLLITAIPVCFSVGVLSKKLTTSKTYAFMVLAIALAVLFHSALVSNYIVYADVQVEYYVFNITARNGFWNSILPQWWDQLYGRFNSMLSVTVLPTIYSSLCGLDTTWTLKIVYPLVFSLVPLGLLLMWKPYVGLKRAFFSTFLFMAQLTFYTEMLGLCRQMIGELFLVLLFMVLVSGKMGRFNRHLCFIAFGAALVVSHYSLSYLFMFFIAFAWASSLVYPYLERRYFPKHIFRRSGKISLTMVIVFLVMAFSWYIYTSGSGTFESFLWFGDNIVSSMGEFGDFGSRGTNVLRGIGMASSPTIYNTASRIVAYVIEAFIVLGFLSVVTKRTKIGFNSEYVAFSWVCMGLLAANVLLPRFAQTLNIERFFHISLFFLTPFCVIGAEVLTGVLTDFLSSRRFRSRQKLNHEMRWTPTILLLAVLLPYFLFQTNFIYEFTGSESWSIPLSKQRIDPIMLHVSMAYIEESDVFGARWLVESVDFNHTKLFADATSIYWVLTSYGMIYRGDVNPLTNGTKLTGNCTVYMSRMNIIDGLAILSPSPVGAKISNTSIIFPMLLNSNKVYTNGACEVYEKSG